MDKLPDDVVKAARRVYDALGRGSVSDSEHIAKALLAERERCAGIADMWSNRDTGRAIAEAIRS